MSRQESDRLFHALASSGAVLPELIKHWQRLCDDAQNQLGNLSVAALLKPDMQPHALIQYGRVQMLNELIQDAERYSSKRSE